jgi:hypothetical protein
MLRASRFVTLSVCAMLLASCNRLSDAKLIGTWRTENDDGTEEIFLKSDHTFRTLETFKKELVTPGVIEELEQWHVEGDQLKFDGTVTWSKRRSQATMRLVQITRDTLVVRRPDARINESYKRLYLPLCAESLVGSKYGFSEKGLVGTWIKISRRLFSPKP